MSTDPNHKSSVDDGIQAIFDSGKKKVSHCLSDWETCVRKHPVQSLLGAVAAGYILHRLPLRSILLAKVRIATALAPPAILAYGAAKLCEILQEKGEPVPPSPDPADVEPGPY